MKIRYKTTLHSITKIAIFFGALTITTATAYAQTPTFSPLVGIPGITDLSTDTSIPDYLNAVYKLTIVLAALFGVLKIAYAGVQYSLSEVITDKHHAKDDIKGVLLGLAILLIPFIVLSTINPNLTNLDVLNTDKMDMNVPSGDQQSIQQVSQNIANGCTPQPGRALPPSCSAAVTPEGLQAATSCTAGGGFYDHAAKRCFTKNSTFTYNTNTGGNWTTGTDASWAALCGENNVVLTPDNSNNTITYKCK